MNQIDQINPHAIPAASALPTVTTALPASSKRHVAGVIHPAILVPMRQIAVHPSTLLMAWMPPPDGIAMCQCDDC